MVSPAATATGASARLELSRTPMMASAGARPLGARAAIGPRGIGKVDTRLLQAERCHGRRSARTQRLGAVCTVTRNARFRNQFADNERLRHRNQRPGGL